MKNKDLPCHKAGRKVRKITAAWKEKGSDQLADTVRDLLRQFFESKDMLQMRTRQQV